jgi:predicted HAD superfamily Cof-like phosphohydrolase
VKTLFDDVREFHLKMDLPVHPMSPSTVTMASSTVLTPPRFLTQPELEHRLAFIREELAEYEEAHAAKDLAACLDALVDLAYVVLGSAHYHHFPFDPAWSLVHAANLTKIPGPSQRFGRDALKPPDFRPPDHLPLLRAAGYKE